MQNQTDSETKRGLFAIASSFGDGESMIEDNLLVLAREVEEQRCDRFREAISINAVAWCDEHEDYLPIHRTPYAKEYEKSRDVILDGKRYADLSVARRSR